MLGAFDSFCEITRCALVPRASMRNAQSVSLLSCGRENRDRTTSKVFARKNHAAIKGLTHEGFAFLNRTLDAPENVARKQNGRCRLHHYHRGVPARKENKRKHE